MLSYDDVLLVPKYSSIESRKEIDIGNRLDEFIRLDIPIISSPMDTVSEEKMAIAMAKAGGMAIIHRYCDLHRQVKMAKDAVEGLDPPGAVAAAVGVKGDFVERAKELIDIGVEVICIDVAHGHHVLMERTIKKLKDEISNCFHLMAGNVAGGDGYTDLSDWGADSIRCNVGGGSICTTRVQTGHGVPGFQTILDCAEVRTNAKIIADGGMRNSGDIVKALAAGADFVIAGSLFAGTNEAPGLTMVAEDGVKYKEYRGMASKKAQASWKGSAAYAEGISTVVPYKGAVSYIMNELKEGIVSGFSYSGARNIRQFWSLAEFIIQTSAGQQESNPHILTRY